MKKVLIVEAEAFLREAYEQVLKAKDVIVVTAEDSECAARQLKESLPDLVIVDVIMPGVNGLELISKLNIKKRFPKTVFLCLSDLSGCAVDSVMIDLGVREHVQKWSLSPDSLVGLVNRHLAAT